MIFVHPPRDQKSQRSQPRQGRRSSKEHRRRTSKDSRGLSAGCGLNLARRHESRRVSATGRVDLPIVQQEELPHEQRTAGSAKDCQTSSRNWRCWRIGSSRQHPTAWASWADWTDSTDADDGERTQTAGLGTGGDEEDGARARRPRALDQHRGQTPPCSEGRIETVGSPDGQCVGKSGEGETPDRTRPRKGGTSQDDLHKPKNRVQKLRGLVAQDPEMTQQAPDSLTALIQLTDQLTAQMRPDQVSQAGGPLLAQLQQGLRASAANRSRTASRSQSISSGSTPPCRRKQAWTS